MFSNNQVPFKSSNPFLDPSASDLFSNTTTTYTYGAPIAVITDSPAPNTLPHPQFRLQTPQSIAPTASQHFTPLLHTPQANSTPQQFHPSCNSQHSLPITLSQHAYSTTTQSLTYSQPQTSTSYSTPNTATPYAYSLHSKINLPHFNKSDPILWFIQAEEQFILFNIRDENTKYSLIVAALPPEISCEVRDVLLQRPVNAPYSTLKSRLLQRLTSSFDERIQRLLQEETLGDRRPTQLLIRMKSLLNSPDALTNSFLKSIFIQRLPDNVREHLAYHTDSKSTEELAEMADKILQSHPQRNSIHVIEHPQPSSTHPTSHYYHAQQHHHESQSHSPHSGISHDCTVNNITIRSLEGTVKSLVDQVASLSLQVHKLSTELDKQRLYVFNQRNSRGSSPTPKYNSTSQPQQKFTSEAKPPNQTQTFIDDICFYHHKFGNKAIKCAGQPCKFAEN